VYNRCAARVKLSSSATATKYSSCLLSTSQLSILSIGAFKNFRWTR
jgi:hypothetical protein